MKWLAMVLALAACAPGNRGPVMSNGPHTEASYVVESHHWNQATVRIWCRRDQRVVVRSINIGRLAKGTFDVGGCSEWHFTVETLARTDTHSFGTFMIQPGDLLAITLEARLEFTSFMIHQ